ncbi:MAG TPA: thioredoxin family protein [Candidatus Krumholzibacteria bacterium]|nr:thioredoxin family protein [Candidatus Krumholzibacteria bacterium]HPD70858.1 thioredoxin family protein [Candidatus Krumholzibacteria bacterium]HRY39442.1 thioredoxin family protein [Candidatus Krumholzibacteria bacterium]
MKVLSTLALLLVAAAALAGVVPGDKAPDFVLPDLDGKEHSLDEYLDQGKIVVLEWFNPDCPFIKKHHLQAHTMNETYERFRDKGVVWLAINSGAEGKQGAGRERNLQAREDYDLAFPLLLDPAGTVGQSYGAKTTPHMFVIKADGTIAYTGAIDDDNSAGTFGKTNHVAEALSAVLAGEPVAQPETRPYGCSVKYAD